jgi:Flp pilus assembly pilin Flp
MWTATSTYTSWMRLLGGLPARLRREEGQTMAEYALLLTLIVVVTAAVVATLGSSISSIFNSVTGAI